MSEHGAGCGEASAFQVDYVALIEYRLTVCRGCWRAIRVAALDLRGWKLSDDAAGAQLLLRDFGYLEGLDLVGHAFEPHDDQVEPDNPRDGRKDRRVWGVSGDRRGAEAA